MTNQAKLEYLFQRYLDRTEDPEELDALMAMIAHADNRETIEQLLDAARQRMAGTKRLDDEQAERLFEAIRQQTGSGKIIPVTRPGTWRRLSVAAAIVTAVGLGGYFLFVGRGGRPGSEAVVAEVAVHDVEAPKQAKASITLADGRTVSIDSLKTIIQDNVQLVKTADGSIRYSGGGTEIAYNTLTNPRGSQVIDMTLADGSRVWLNAGSAVTYPVAFAGRERKVTMTGEAYFEISQDKTIPFYVSKGDMQVQVLGTQFNINAYNDEPAIRVTLLEGSVNVRNGDKKIMLKPGQQASLAGDGIAVSDDVPVEEVMAWKNGLFEFNETDLQTIMRQIARWYDVQVVFDTNITRHFNGNIPREVNVSKVLSLLEKTGGLRFSIEGNKVIVRK